MDDFYRENILDHYRNPRNKGSLESPTHSHEEDNPLCGDVIRIDLHVNGEDVIDQVRFDGHGCAISQASASMLTEMVQGKTLEEAKKITKKSVAESLDGLPEQKMHCSNLGADALAKAIEDYEIK